MRKLAIGVVLCIAATSASAASPAGPPGACASGLPAAPAGLPWPVVLQTHCGRFTVGTDGSVVVQPGPSLPVPAGATWSPRDGRWWKVVGGHLFVGRWHETLWRSHGTFRLTGQVGDFATAPDGTLFFLQRGRLLSTNGGRPTVLASVAALGFSGTPELEALGPLVALRDRHLMVVLRSDGSHFASTPLPPWKKRTDDVSSAVATDAAADAVAFTATEGNTAFGSTGTETTVVLRAGDTSATAVHTARIDFKVCERMAEVSWHDHWLLYSASEGNIAAIDADDASHSIDLSAFAQALPGTQDDDSEGGLDIDATWA